MSKKSLEALKAAFQTPESEQRSNLPNNYYPFWLMKNGQKAVVRFLPDRDENNVRGFLVEKVFHNLTINGQKKNVPCLSMYGEDCPICKVSQDYYKLKDETNGKKYWRKKQYIAQVLVVEDPLPADETSGENHEGKVRFVSLGYQLYTIIKDAFASDELEAVPYDFEDGYDFIIKKSEQGNYSTYVVGSKFKGSPRPLSEEELAIVEEGMIELATLLPKNPGDVKVQALLNADLNGESVDESGTEEDDAPAKPAAKKPAAKIAAKSADDDDEEEQAPAKTVVKKPAAKVVAEADTDDKAMTDVDAMLAAIRARKNKS
jgi:hypothetical protein